MGGSFNSDHFRGTSGSPQRPLDLGQETGHGTGGQFDSTTPQPTSASVRDTLMSEATTDTARSIVNELYREGSGVGDGGTADAIRHELATGELVGGRSHIQKGRERLRQIERILRRNPNHPDRELLERLADDLRDALGGN